MASNMIATDKRIAIIGAGPAGLSTAWFLAKHGYDRVTVLERLGRVGGLCKSITIKGQSFDLGANYVTWGYPETLKIAKEVGATTYREKPYISIEIDEKNEKMNFRNMVDAVLEDPDTHEKISRWAFIVAAVRYLIIRIKLKPVIDPPNAFSSIHGKEHPLLVSFKEWLGCRGLDPLETLFSFPITIMGYGQLADIPAPYALKYMSVKTFFPMVATSIPLIGPLMKLLFPWPRRFHLGFQRLWQRVAWRTNVRLNINITEIDRQEEQIRIKFEYPQQKLNELKIVESCMDFDYLVLACPLTPDVFARMRLTPTQKEEAMSDKIIINPYCMTTYWIEKDMPQPVAPVLPIPERGVPWAVARQFQGRDKNHFTQFYTRPKDEWDKDKIEKHVKEGVQWLVKLMDSKIDPTHSRWHSFDEFTYFQHVNCDAWKAGFYCELAKMQGGKNTFYVGGATDFELVEPIVAYAKHIVESRFVGAVS